MNRTSSTRDAPNAEKRKRGRPTKTEKAARRGKSMGRYPLMAAIEQYLEIRKRKVRENTYKNDARILRHIGRTMEQMRERGQIATTHPASIGDIEINAFNDWMNDPGQHKTGKALDLDTQVRYMAKLDDVLQMQGNKIIQTMCDNGYRMPTPAGPKPVHAMSQDQLDAINSAVDRVKPAIKQLPSWKVAKLSMIANGYSSVGMRPSELLEVKMDEVDLTTWKIHVSKPKGQGKYAQERDSLIMPQYRDFYKWFLGERQKYLESYGRTEAIYLIPNLEYGKDTKYSTNTIRKLKRELEDASGIKFRLKDYRSSFVSISINSGALPKDVAYQVGHRTENTTLRYYHQIDAEESSQRLEKVWEDRSKPKVPTALPATPDNPVMTLLKALGINSVEDLIAHLPQTSQPQQTPINRGIENEKPLAGYQ